MPQCVTCAFNQRRTVTVHRYIITPHQHSHNLPACRHCSMSPYPCCPGQPQVTCQPISRCSDIAAYMLGFLTHGEQHASHHATHAHYMHASCSPQHTAFIKILLLPQMLTTWRHTLSHQVLRAVKQKYILGQHASVCYMCI